VSEDATYAVKGIIAFGSLCWFFIRLYASASSGPCENERNVFSESNHSPGSYWWFDGHWSDD
jgi:hypothetical protein